jgi:hypothetical protein
MWKNRNVKQKQEQKLAITNDYFGQGWEKIVGDLSRMCGKLYVCTHRFGLCFVLQINKVVAIRWLQSQSPPKVMTSVYVIGWKLLSFLPFPRAYKAKLISLPWDMMMWLKLSGGYVNLRFVEINRIIIKKMRWLKLACWHFCYLADKRTD